MSILVRVALLIALLTAVAFGAYLIGRGESFASSPKNPSPALRVRVVDSIDDVVDDNHDLVANDSTTMVGHGKGRNGRSGRETRGGWFSWKLAVDPFAPMQLRVTYWGNVSPERSFGVFVDDAQVATQKLFHDKPGEFFDVEYVLAPELTRGKKSITVRFQSPGRGQIAGQVMALKSLVINPPE